MLIIHMKYQVLFFFEIQIVFANTDRNSFSGALTAVLNVPYFPKIFR